MRWFTRMAIVAALAVAFGGCELEEGAGGDGAGGEHALAASQAALTQVLDLGTLPGVQ